MPDDHWINKPLAEEDDKTLLMVAIEASLHPFMEVLLDAGASASAFNRELDLCPIHVAAKHADVRALNLLLKNPRNRADVNAVAKSKGGQTALHMAVAGKSFDFAEALLKQPGIEVNVKDKKGGKTPLYLAVKGGSKELASSLIAAGADYSHSCFGKMIYPDLINEFMPDLDPTQIPRKSVPLVRQLSQGVYERLVEIVDTSALNGYTSSSDLELFKSILLEADANSLNSRKAGDYTLLQKAAFSGLAEIVSAILEVDGVSSEVTTDGATMTPVLLAAYKGHFGVLKQLKEHGADFTAISKETSETVLHYLLKSGMFDEQRYVDSINYLITSPDLRPQIRKIVNKRDMLETTALHYATQKWPQEIVRGLLEIGANIGMKNHWNETPISKISPKTMEEFLDEFCIESKGDVNHENFEITFNYSFLAPPKEDLPYSTWNLASDPESQKLSDLDDSQRVALPETQSLWYMGQSKEHRHLLKHPVVTSFLYLKWQRIRRYFNRNLRFYLLFVFVLTWYIFDQFGGQSIRHQPTNEIPFLHGLFIIFGIVVFTFILRDWIMDARDLMAAEKVRESNPNEEGAHSCGKLLCTIAFSNWIEVIFIGFIGTLIVVGPKALWIALIILTVLLAIREFLQVTVSLKRYIFGPENWLEVSMIVLITGILSIGDEGDMKSLKRHMAAIALVLSWAELITLVGKHPKLTRYNVYVTMFYKVMGTFFFFLCWYMFFIIAFGLGFYIMLHKDMPGDEIGEEDYIFFNKPWLALVKTSTMFVGELEFSDIPIDLESRFSPLSFIFFLSFVFLIVVVLMNLLNGLAVSDTGAIQEKAEIYGYISQVETISYTESILLGDPFNFLSNWPTLKWLLNVPSCSLCRQLYRNRFIQQMFHKVTGATGILLFYNFLPTKKLCLMPNDKRNRCGFLTVRSSRYIKNPFPQSYSPHFADRGNERGHNCVDQDHYSGKAA